MEPITVKPVTAEDTDGFMFGNQQQLQPQTPISAKRVVIWKRRNNPLRNPISSFDEWTDLKAEDIEIGSHQSYVGKSFNPLLKPVSAEDTVGFMFGNQQQLQSQSPISGKRVVIRKGKNYLDPLRNPISSFDQWSALKAEDIEIGSHQSYVGNRFNPLLKPVSAEDTEGFMFGNQQQLQSQTPISGKRVVIRKGKNYLNPLRNPIYSFDQWSALKAEDIEIGSHQSSVEKSFNFQSSVEIRSTEDTETFMVDNQQSQPETPISVKQVLIRKKKSHADFH